MEDVPNDDTAFRFSGDPRQRSPRIESPSFSNWCRLFVLLFLATLFIPFFFSRTEAASRIERIRFQKSIVDYRKKLNRRFKKVRRKKTKYIVIHTSEGGLRSTLRVVSEGKRIRRRYRTKGGHAHYVIARNGKTYRILDKKYRADHAGRSMWKGETDISSVSIGIELVGYHYTEITDKQYYSLSVLIDILRRVYKLDDSAVLTHSQVAYGKPNRWLKKRHRGRKRCAKNFDRKRAGCGPGPAVDPDVKAGRLVADRELAAIFYGGRKATVSSAGSNIIARNNSAWQIAGEDYDDPSTLYKLPGGRIVSGDRLGAVIGWNRIPRGTEVFLNQETAPIKTAASSPVKTIADGLTAWTFAGKDYRKKTTHYFFPGGRVKNGGQISDWDELPPQTRMIVGYRGPFRITAKRPPVKIAGGKYRDRRTVYLFPDASLRTGDSIRNFRRLPRGVQVFVPLEAPTASARGEKHRLTSVPG